MSGGNDLPAPDDREPVLRIPVPEFGATVEVPLHDLPDDPDDLTQVLASELAPYRVWLSAAALYRHRGQRSKARSVLAQVAEADSEVMRYPVYRDDVPGRSQVLTAIGTLSAEEALGDVSGGGASARADALETYRRGTKCGPGAQVMRGAQVAQAVLALRERRYAEALRGLRGLTGPVAPREVAPFPRTIEADVRRMAGSARVAACMGVAVAEHAAGEPACAAESLANAIELFPNLPARVRSALGTCLAEAGCPDAAAEAFVRALAMDNNCTDAMCGLAALVLSGAVAPPGSDGAEGEREGEREGDSAARSSAVPVRRRREAWSLIERALEVAPGDPVVLLSAARFTFLAGRYEMAMTAANRALIAARTPRAKAEAHLLAGRALHALGRVDEAASRYGYARDECGDSSAGASVLAELNFPMGQIYLARGEYTAALRSLEAHLALVAERAATAPAAAAAAAAAKGARGRGGDDDGVGGVARKLAGIAASRTGDRDTAKRHLEAADAALGGADAEVRLELARLAENEPPKDAAKKVASAIRALRDAGDSIPSELWHNAGTYKHLAGDKRGARRAYIFALRATRAALGDDAAAARHPVEDVLEGKVSVAVPNYGASMAPPKPKAPAPDAGAGAADTSAMDVDEGDGAPAADQAAPRPEDHPARAPFESVLGEVPPAEVTTLFNLARLLEDSGSAEAAAVTGSAEDAEDAAAAEENGGGAGAGSAGAFLARADAIYRSILASHRSYTSAYLGLASIAARQSHTAAMAILSRTKSGGTYPVDVGLMRGALNFDRRKFDSAQREFSAVAKEVRSGKPVFYGSIGAGNAALAQAAQCKRDASKRAAFLKQAYVHFATVLESGSRGLRSVHAANGLGCVLAEMGFVHEAHDVFLAIRDADKDFDDARLNLAHTAAILGRHVAAVRAYEAIAQRLPESQRKGPLVYAARAHLAAKNVSAAREVLSRAIAHSPDDTVLLYNLAYILEQLADEDIRPISASRAAGGKDGGKGSSSSVVVSSSSSSAAATTTKLKARDEVSRLESARGHLNLARSLFATLSESKDPGLAGIVPRARRQVAACDSALKGVTSALARAESRAAAEEEKTKAALELVRAAEEERKERLRQELIKKQEREAELRRRVEDLREQSALVNAARREEEERDARKEAEEPAASSTRKRRRKEPRAKRESGSSSKKAARAAAGAGDAGAGSGDEDGDQSGGAASEAGDTDREAELAAKLFGDDSDDDSHDEGDGNGKATGGNDSGGGNAAGDDGGGADGAEGGDADADSNSNGNNNAGDDDDDDDEDGIAIGRRGPPEKKRRIVIADDEEDEE